MADMASYVGQMQFDGALSKFVAFTQRPIELWANLIAAS